VNHCTHCHADLLPHNVTGLCAECKHIDRARRTGFAAGEVSNLDEARHAFMAVFGGHYRILTAEPQRTRRPTTPKTKRKRVTK